MQKQCKICQESLIVGKNWTIAWRNNSDYKCVKCHYQIYKDWGKAHPQSKFVSNCLAASKRRARELNIEHNLTHKYLMSIYSDTCPVFKVKFTLGERYNDASPNLDRIDTSKGYIEGNVAFICYRANRLKGNATVDEVAAILKYMNNVH